MRLVWRRLSRCAAVIGRSERGAARQLHSSAFVVSLAVAIALGNLPANARSKAALPDLSEATTNELAAKGIASLRIGKTAEALPLIAELTSREPRNASYQALLGLAYHLRGSIEPQSIDLAMAGYDLSLRAEPGQFWPAAMAGRAAFDQGKYAEALNHFAKAVLLRPQDPRLLGGLSAAAYLSGDTALAQIAAERAAALNPADHAVLRGAAISAAAQGDEAAASTWLARLREVAPEMTRDVQARVAQLLQTSAVDEGGTAPAGGESLPSAASPDQVSLDVAIILSQNSRREHSGLNLLDGLRLQYGVNRQSTRTNFQDGANGIDANTYQRVITSSISVPQLNYNLNIFNRSGQFYSVVARPQLTAYRSEQSEFFVGRVIKVAVSGINQGQLEQIEIGIDMKVTPIAISADGTRIRIETGRSFLMAEPAGNFRESLTTFKQRVAATAEIRFGETLLLSGLTETVDDKTNSKTPVLGDLPLLGNAFNERNLSQKRDSVLILVTPQRPLSLPGRPFARSEHAQRLADLWTRVVDPMSNAAVAAARLARMRMFTRMTRSDVSMPFPDAASAAGEMINDLMIPQDK